MEQKLAYMTTSQVADYFRVDPSTVRRWVLAGKLKPAIKTLGGYYRFDPEAVEQLASEPSPALAN